MIDLGLDAFDGRQARVEAAARSIVALCRSDQFGIGWRPKGVDEIAILLESLGYSPEIVAELWSESLFELAAEVSVLVDQYVDDDERTVVPDASWFARTCRDYAIGALYSGPWIIAVLGLAVFGSALWSSLSTPLHLATTIALGVYAALVIAGAFSQAIARRLTFYFLQDNIALMKWTLDRFIAGAIGTFVVLGFAGWLALRPTYGDVDAGLAAAFFVGSGIFQTSLAPLYTMRRFTWIIAVSFVTTLITGATFAFAFRRVVDLPWEPATLASEIGIAGLLVMGATAAWMNRKARATGARADLMAPAPRAIAGSALPYAVFGCAYFGMIVADRIAAGMSGGWPFAYRAGYELGCDIALLAVIPVVGVINVALEGLPRAILAGSTSRIADRGALDGSMARFYVRSALAVLVSAAIAVGVAEVLALLVLERTRLGNSGPDGEEAKFVLRFAAAGYGVLMLALLNCQFLFFLSRPTPAVRAACAGAATCIAGAAALMIAHAPPAWCAFALVAGIAVFAVWTTIAAYRTMARFTFAYYAAY